MWPHGRHQQNGVPVEEIADNDAWQSSINRMWEGGLKRLVLTLEIEEGEGPKRASGA